ncbi:hypothetical protein [uncultured Lactobacillus sp.]|uniref:hypothetical protein n=1 Tax=uncultured Lactobacillus sp. TaxID=153152 RepID=UPI0026312AAE|nr:hypothetical protein [uncultured Lactobacillus sp.]
MKSIIKIILRLVMVGLTTLSFWLLMTSDVSLKINNTQAMGKEVINRVVADSDNPSLKTGVKLLEASGLEQTLLEQLPPKYRIDLSYADLYKLCEKYNDQGRLTTKDLNLTSKTKLEEIINEYLVKQINHKLKEDSEDVNHIVTIYEYSILVVALLFLLAVILILFGRPSASIPLFLATLASFIALWIVSNETMIALQSRVYSGIMVTLSQEIWFGLTIGIIAAVVWPFLNRLTKRKKN